MTAAYTYQRKDGGTTDCYGDIRQDSNFEIACENEIWDEIVSFENPPRSWRSVCQRLEKNVNAKIEQIIAC